MAIAYTVLALIFAFAMTSAAAAKLKKSPDVMALMDFVGVEPWQIPLLATFEIIGAAGLLIGIGSPLIGTVSAMFFVIYFSAALFAHKRAQDVFVNRLTPFTLLLLAICLTLLKLNA